LNVSDEALHLQVYMKNCMIKPKLKSYAVMDITNIPNGIYYSYIIQRLITQCTIHKTDKNKIFVN